MIARAGTEGLERIANAEGKIDFCSFGIGGGGSAARSGEGGKQDRSQPINPSGDAFCGMRQRQMGRRSVAWNALGWTLTRFTEANGDKPILPDRSISRRRRERGQAKG